MLDSIFIISRFLSYLYILLFIQKGLSVGARISSYTALYFIREVEELEVVEEVCTVI